MPEDRCSRCHRYKKNAPSPELSHVGSQGESKCKLDHHPSPCDYTDENGEVCNAESNETIDDEPATKENVRQMEEKFSQQSLDLDRMRSEMEEMRKMMGSMRMTASPRDSLVTTTATAPAYSTVFSANSTVPQPSVVPLHQVRSSAAGILTSEAQSLLLANDGGGMQPNVVPGYSGPTMKDLQQDKSISDEVQRQMDNFIARIPALQKVVAGQPLANHPPPHQQSSSYQACGGAPHVAFQAIQAGAAGASLGGDVAQREDINLLDMDSMLGLTVREKQYRPHEFACRGNFFYAKNINEKNITLPLYTYGYLKHCIILLSGMVPVAEGEVMARLINLMNICEITSNNSTLNDFEHHAWQLGKGYGDRVLNDIQQGLRSWSEMPNHILPDVFLHVKDMVDIQGRKREDVGGGRGRGRGKKVPGQVRSSSDRPGGAQGGEKTLVCTSYNDFFTGSGCAYEYTNQRKCNYEHYCSKCFTATGTKIGHKARFCTGSGVAPATSTPTSG